MANSISDMGSTNTNELVRIWAPDTNEPQTVAGVVQAVDRFPPGQAPENQDLNHIIAVVPEFSEEEIAVSPRKDNLTQELTEPGAALRLPMHAVATTQLEPAEPGDAVIMSCDGKVTPDDGGNARYQYNTRVVPAEEWVEADEAELFQAAADAYRGQEGDVRTADGELGGGVPDGETEGSEALSDATAFGEGTDGADGEGSIADISDQAVMYVAQIQDGEATRKELESFVQDTLQHPDVSADEIVAGTPLEYDSNGEAIVAHD